MKHGVGRPVRRSEDRRFLTGADYRADGLGSIPCMSIGDAVATGPARLTPTPALALDTARHVGAPVAFVVFHPCDTIV